MRKFCVAFFCFYLLSPLAVLSQNVGIGNTAPQQMLDVSGAVKIGNTTSGMAGSIRWTGAGFEGHDGVQWTSLTGDDQQLSVSNDTLYLEDGGFAVLPAGTGNVNDADADPTNEFQNLGNSVAGADITITITDGTSTTFSMEDADTTNELNSAATLSGTDLHITDAGGTLTVDLSSLQGSGGATHCVGELFGGGIVFWVSPDGQHGKIASLDDLDGGSGVAWSNVTTTQIGGSAQGMTDGAANTAAIISQSGHTSSAAKLCADYTGGGFTDWYLPSNREFYLLALQDVTIDYVLDNDGVPATNGLIQENVPPTYSKYWTSTEYSSGYAWYYYFLYGNARNTNKSYVSRVRAVRTF